MTPDVRRGHGDYISPVHKRNIIRLKSFFAVRFKEEKASSETVS